MRIDAGRATEIRVRAAARNHVAGQVIFVDDGAPVTSGGTILIEVSAGPGRYFTLTADVGPDGFFAREFENPFADDTRTIELHYLGSFSAAACTTGPLPV